MTHSPTPHPGGLVSPLAPGRRPQGRKVLAAVGGGELGALVQLLDAKGQPWELILFFCLRHLKMGH